MVNRTVIAVVLGSALLVSTIFPYLDKASAATLFVNASTGIDSNTCLSSGAACLTIQAAINKALAGDTINVAVGTYTELVTINKANLILTATGAATIQNPAAGFALVTISSNGVSMNGFTIHSSATMDFTVSVAANSATLNNVFLQKDKTPGGAAVNIASGVTGFTMSGGSITSAFNGIIVTGTSGILSSNINIAGVTFNVSGGDFSVLLLAATNSAVTGNTFATSSNLLSHIILGDTDGVTISGNTINGPTAASFGFGIWFQATGFLASPIDMGTVTVSSNTVTGGNVGVFLDADLGIETPDIHIKLNTISGNTVGIDNDSTFLIDAENNFWGCSGGPGTIGCDTVTGNVDFTPFLTTAPGTGTSVVAPAGATTAFDAQATAGFSGSVTTAGGQTTTLTAINLANNVDPSNVPTLLVAGKFVDVSLSNPAAVTSLTVTIFYTNTDLANAGVDESLLVPMFFIPATNTWVAASNFVIDPTDITGPPAFAGKITITITGTTTPNLSQLQGTFFGTGTGNTPLKATQFNHHR